ncbi:MAG: type II secretion system F family protein [Propionibacteriales bacterium]|nr:type II secretion system F family protein [Propionibacteriales bacterium]
MGAVVGLAFGLGVVLLGSALLAPAGSRRPAPTVLVVDLLARAGMDGVRPRAVTGAAAALGLVVALVMQALSRTPPIAVVFGCLAAYLPVAYLRGRARRRQREFAEVWPEVVDHLASGVRAGLGLAEALADLADRGPEPLRPAFAAFALDYQTSGRLAESLDRLKARLADPVGDRVVEALRIAREVGGGDLGRLLRNLAQFLREDARTRSELEARQAWAVNGARLAVSAPWLVLLMLSFQSAVIRRYASTEGLLVLGTGAVTCLGAYALMSRIGRLPVERRILS